MNKEKREICFTNNLLASSYTEWDLNTKFYSLLRKSNAYNIFLIEN